ncbi:spore protease YyaC [Edaphobacillus lindanitolerans]|uniref:Putative sporulation protein YyaC n=1 Tax=Edaphobacillus lindanitolerans TaxID=550447 RepID=A0A1U7PR46_9BACI|nr:spore protease YyaC [Edaphobacillus lindanitolerans]SIT87061.1 putative sporulation protein YyaC [Edaphobacillus lindanitolerans]
MTTITALSVQERFHHSEPGCAWRLSSALLRHVPFGRQPVRFVCIGTDRSTGDSYGPLTGTALGEQADFPFPLIGTLEQPLHALNLEQKLNPVGNPADVFTVAIDACLGKAANIGQIIVEDRPLMPGRAVGKSLPPVGDLSIKGVVNAALGDGHEALRNTRLHLPFMMSRLTARAILLAWHRHESKAVQDARHSGND